MKPPDSSTRFADATRLQAMAVIALAILGLVWLLSAKLSHAPFSPGLSKTTGGDDLALYRRVVERVHASESYYQAAGEELRQRGYPTGSIFNWRPPTYAWVLGALPGARARQGLLMLGVLVALILAYERDRQEGSPIRGGCTVALLVGVFAWCVDGEAFYAQELWAATLLSLSILAYAGERWYLGWLTGMASLFFRELVLPYAAISMVFAWRDGRRREVALWGAGLLFYAGFMTWHGHEVLKQITTADLVDPEGWVQFGGARFLLATVKMNAYLFNLPDWVAALYLVTSLIGLAGWRGSLGSRVGLTASAYIAAFAIVGKPINNYWGLIVAPLLVFGVVRAPLAIRDLCGALALRRMIPATSGPAGRR